MSEQRETHLVRFGNTDLWVSRLCQGTAFRHLERSELDERGVAVLHHCLDVGVNFFDSAEAYGWGGAERALGKAVKGRRDEVVLCTKVPGTSEPTSEGDPGEKTPYTRETLHRRVEGSLERLQTDYLDLYLLHHNDGVTPAEDIVESMEALVQAGKVRYWGVSNHDGASLNALVQACQTKGKTLLAGVEEYYNIAGLLDQNGQSRMATLEREVFPILRRTGLGILTFSPMDTGRLRPGHEEQAEPELRELIAVIDAVADDLGVLRSVVCTAWVLSHAEVTSVLAGSESTAHVDENLAGTQLQLPTAALDRLNAASQTYRKKQLER
jgi:aryl-alcohol dehydrogenase-like predicted oxidoreductase